MKKLSFVAVLGLALFLIFGVVPQSVQAETAVINISGMSCDDCVDRVQAALMKMDGVEKAVVDFKKSSADVTFDSTVLKVDDIQNSAVESDIS